jgi:serine/threonine protein kinase
MTRSISWSALKHYMKLVKFNIQCNKQKPFLSDNFKIGFLHRDIKPDNLAMGLDDNSSTLYMLDLGLGKRFKYDNRHISYRTDKHLTGTARYASLHSHAGEGNNNFFFFKKKKRRDISWVLLLIMLLELSRRDDLESIAYTLIYMSKGKLPWQGLRSDLYGSKYDKIYAMKKKISPAQLCKNLEPEFIEFLEYARNLLFTEKPDYERCRQMFRNVMIRKKLEMDYIYCWTVSRVCYGLTRF